MSVDYGVLIGRFNPPHIGHEKLVRNALEKCNKKLFIIIGSDLTIRTNQNMFFVNERIEMLKLCFGESEIQNIIFLSMPDYNNPKIWVDEVKRLTFEQISALESKNSNISMGIFGFNKDASSYYLKMFPEFEQMIIENSYFDCLSSTSIRNKLCGDVSNINKTMEIQFLYNGNTSFVDENVMNPKVCDWIRNNFNPNIKFNDKIVDALHVLLNKS